MTQLDSLFDQLKAFDRPPVESWWPETTVEFDLCINAKGEWYHEGGIIPRHSLVKLFSTVLALREGEHYLVTPGVQYRIQVEQAPFLGVEVSRQIDSAGQEIFVRTNMDEVFRLDNEHPLTVYLDEDTGEPRPLATVRDGLQAKLTRSVYYQLVDWCESTNSEPEVFGIQSAGQFFPLG